jgi:hypothetical protein
MGELESKVPYYPWISVLSFPGAFLPFGCSFGFVFVLSLFCYCYTHKRALVRRSR